MKERLTLDQIRQLAPAVFSDRPQADVSARYQFIPSLPIVQHMLDNGWQCISAHQREDDPFAAHRLTFSVPTVEDRSHLGEFVPTAHLINSHNRTRRIEFSAGLDVCICSNQLHMPVEGVSDRISRIHLEGARIGLTDVLADVLSAHTQIAATVGRMQAHQLTEEQRVLFAKRALCEADGHASVYFIHHDAAEALLHVNRESQAAPTVWNTLNTVQENLVERGRKGRGIHEIIRNHNLNVTMWTTATALLERN